MIPAFLLPFIPGKDLLIKAAVVAVIAVSVYAVGYVKGSAKEQAKHLTFVGEQAVASQKLYQARIETVRVVEKEYVYRDRVIREKGETIIKEIPVYVTKADDSRCDVNVGFVRSYNAAVANDLDSAPPGDGDRAASGVPLSTVAETSAYNLTLGHRWKAKALACIKAYESIRAQ